jgi:sulfofructose kinase
MRSRAPSPASSASRRVQTESFGAKARARDSAPKVVAIDTHAAGDVWHGALTLAVAEGPDVAGAVRLGNAAAAIECYRAGERLGTSRRDEVTTLLSAEW